MIRIVHADDHSVVRAGLAMVLSEEDDFEILGQASDGAQALALIEAHKPDVALLDFSMPTMNGLEATAHIADVFPETKVIILSVHEHRQYAIRALQAGASGYMHKGASDQAICEAIRKVHAGQRAMPAHLEDLEAANVPPGSALDVWDLSKREQQVFYLLAECRTSHEAAEELGVSVKTVDSHRGQIMRKLGLRGNSELTRFAIKEGLIKP